MLLGLVACAREPARVAPACPPCRGGFVRDAPRATEIARQWRRVASPSYADLELRCLCFGPGPSTVVEGENLNLPVRAAVAEQTARAAHLALHRRDPPWDRAGNADCTRAVRLALEREVEAHALELETRRRLGAARPRYPFERAYFAQPRARRRQWLRELFEAHPTGDGVVPGLIEQYRRRCVASGVGSD